MIVSVIGQENNSQVTVQLFKVVVGVVILFLETYILINKPIECFHMLNKTAADLFERS